jgi:hypothetical protein
MITRKDSSYRRLRGANQVACIAAMAPSTGESRFYGQDEGELLPMKYSLSKVTT